MKAIHVFLSHFWVLGSFYPEGGAVLLKFPPSPHPASFPKRPIDRLLVALPRTAASNPTLCSKEPDSLASSHGLRRGCRCKNQSSLQKWETRPREVLRLL
jgi:hypothetical protein